MSLARVVITPEVFLTCTTHALSTEAEEIMGVLLGHVESVGEGGGAHVYVRRAVPQIRTDRRKDRVETSPEQMATCSALAESVTASTGIPTQVVGWYHSHPHITVLPSHVDVSTQALYQMLDPGFVGLIFSVFNAAPSGAHTIQVTAFQALPAGAPGAACELHSCDSDELEAQGIDSSVRAAIQASAAATRAARGDGWVRKEVPLLVAAADQRNPATLADYVELQHTLLAEEQQAHAAAAAAPTRAAVTGLHAALLQLQDSAAHQLSLLAHAECALAPALVALQAQVSQADVQVAQLEADNQRLQGLLLLQQKDQGRQHSAAAAAAASSCSRDLASHSVEETLDALK